MNQGNVNQGCDLLAETGARFRQLGVMAFEYNLKRIHTWEKSTRIARGLDTWGLFRLTGF